MKINFQHTYINKSKLHLLLTLLFAFVFTIPALTQTRMVNTPGSGTYTVPDGATHILVQCWGAGGKGGNSGSSGGGGGGGGGAFSSSIIAVTPGQTINFHVGAGGGSKDTQFGATGNIYVLAKGGLNGSDAAILGSANGGAGGKYSDGIGMIRYSGGDGAKGSASAIPSSGYGGGGGSSGGMETNGSNGSERDGGTVTGGGGGGKGSDGAGNGSPGVCRGGGGGGSKGSGGNGAIGANGAIRISVVKVYDVPGIYEYTVRHNMSTIQVEVWGGGGKGGSRTSSGVAGGGGGGGYSRSVLGVHGGEKFNITVGVGGKDGSIDGGASSFVFQDNSSIKVEALGGKGVANNSTTGGAGAAAGTGERKFAGGSGADGSGNNSGGGGSSGGNITNGVNGSGTTGGTVNGGGSGGNGVSSIGKGNTGKIPGGGGGGARSSNSTTYNGGNGADGWVVVTELTDPILWFRADRDITLDGTGVTAWADQATTGRIAVSTKTSGTGFTASSNYPQYLPNSWNFNPGISFSDGYLRHNRGLIEDDFTFIFIYSSEQTTTNGSWWLSPAIIGNEADGTNADFGIGHNDGRLFFKSRYGNNFDVQTASGVSYNNGKPKLVTAKREKGSGKKNYIFVDGKKEGEGDSDDVSLTNAGLVGIGRNPTEAGSQFEGTINEIIAFNHNTSGKEIRSYESYLAVKYGITLDHDYVHEDVKANDSIFYSIADGYKYDIAGLGRCYMYQLDQRVSASSNLSKDTISRIVIATTDDFETANLDENRVSLPTTHQFLLLGHNNVSEGSSWMTITGKNYKKIARTWKAHNTNNVAKVYFQINLKDYPALSSNKKYAILYNKTADFSEESTTYEVLEHSSGNLYQTSIKFPDGISYFTIGEVPENNYWVGTTDTDWDKTSNWAYDMVPQDNKDIVFATVANYGTAAQNDLVVPAGLSNAKTIGKLINASDKNLIIPADAHLTVTDEVRIGTLFTDPSKIQILANESLPNGTFIINCDKQSNASQKDIYVTVEMYAKGKEDSEKTWTDNIEDSPTYGQVFTSKYHWQYFGVPVEAVKASPTFDGAAIRYYTEAWNGDNSSYYQKWQNIYNEDILTAFSGYEITQKTPTKYRVAGKLVYCDQEVTMTRKAPQVGDSGAANEYYGLGQNIYGNSFTAAIDVNEINFPYDVEQTVYLYNTGRFSDWGENADDFETLNSNAGQYFAIPKNASPLVYDGQIPSMNGFLVKFVATQTTPNGSNVTLTIPYKNAVEPNTKPQTAPKVSLSYLKLQLQSKSTRDNLWLVSHEGTTSRFDNGWDGFKFFGTPTAFIFSQSADGHLQIDTDRSIDGKRISFYANEESDYTLIIEKNNLKQYEELYLIDLATRQTIQLSNEISQYKFSSTNKGVVERRFLISQNPIDWESGEVNLLDAYYLSHGELVLNNYTGKAATIKIFELSGRLVQTIDSEQTVNERFALNLPRGIYIATAQAGSQQVTLKLIVK